MSKRIFEISMSLDGFITATDQSADNPMGHDESGSSGHVLHQWVHNYEHETAEATVPDTRRPDVFGAIICGRRTYETSLPWWQADGPSGPLRLPVVVLASGQPTNTCRTTPLWSISMSVGHTSTSQRVAIGPLGYEDRIYRRKAKATPPVRIWSAEAERLLTLRESHRLTGIPRIPRTPAPEEQEELAPSFQPTDAGPVTTR